MDEQLGTGRRLAAASMNRRRFLAAAVLAGAGTALVASPAFAGTSIVQRSAVQATATATDPDGVEPVAGAGLFDVDPDQGDVSQDPNVILTGDVDALPEDWEF